MHVMNLQQSKFMRGVRDSWLDERDVRIRQVHYEMSMIDVGTNGWQLMLSATPTTQQQAGEPNLRLAMSFENKVAR